MSGLDGGFVFLVCCQVTFVVGNTELVRPRSLSVNEVVLSSNDLEEVLIHVSVRGVEISGRIKRAVNQAKSFLHLFGQVLVVLLTLVFKFELVDDVAEAVNVAVLEVRHEFLNVEVVLQVRSSRGEVEVADDLVDGYFAFEVASFGRHFVNFVGPMFCDALLDGVGVAKAPAAVKVSLSHILASLAASGFWRFTAVARTAIAFSALSSQTIQFSLELLVDLSIVDPHHILVHTSLDESVVQVLLMLSADVHDVQVQEEAWHLRERNIQRHGETLASTSVHNNRGIYVYSSVVHEFDEGEGADDCGG